MSYQPNLEQVVRVEMTNFLKEEESNKQEKQTKFRDGFEDEETLKERSKLEELSKKFEIHPNRIMT